MDFWKITYYGLWTWVGPEQIYGLIDVLYHGYISIVALLSGIAM